MQTASRPLFIMAILLVTARFANAQPITMPCPARGATVFVADGAGNFQRASHQIRQVVKTDGYPIEVVTYEWSHGNGRILRDQLDFQHARREGKKLAALIVDYHAANPDRAIYMFAHSAGSAVVLFALEQAPAGSVERAVLLSPSISQYYDIRPALRAVKEDIRVFHSRHDLLYLGVVTRLIGTSDGWRTATAGRVGFVPIADPDDPDLFGKLIQRPWTSADRQLGHNGGHFGGYQPDFVRTHIIPLLLSVQSY